METINRKASNTNIENVRESGRLPIKTNDFIEQELQ